jgi:hypothetical protein
MVVVEANDSLALPQRPDRPHHWGNTVFDNREGILLSAGGSGMAHTNDVEMTVKKNTVCGSAVTDIHAIGGFFGIPALLPPNQGAGNTVEGNITQNTADSVVGEDGVAGNVAQVTQTKNVLCP